MIWIARTLLNCIRTVWAHEHGGLDLNTQVILKAATTDDDDGDVVVKKMPHMQTKESAIKNKKGAPMGKKNV